MARIAFILLCHKAPADVIAQAESLTAAGDFVAIHYDAGAPVAEYRRIREALSANPNVTFADKRIKCGWGEWSLVAATLAACRAALDTFPRASHAYMVSGDCMPIKSAAYVHAYLDDHDADFIESVDYFESDWIKTGMKEERLIYRHFLNERKHKLAFYLMLQVQKALGLKRAIPRDLEMMIGSQWWCLRRKTLEDVLQFVDDRPDVIRFFRTTWIPDETFFQTLVRHLIPQDQIQSRTLTFLMFSDYGMPVSFYNDHYDMLLAQDYLFARKISPGARDLKQRLSDLWTTEDAAFDISNEGRALFAFLTQKGRVGRRFAPRFWEAEASLGHERELLLVVCKKWHVAQRLVGAFEKDADFPLLGFVFSQEDVALPDLGGIQTSLVKRHRHRRALLRMLFDYYDRDKMLICLDSSDLVLIREFCSDQATTRVLEIEPQFSDAYLKGHARRAGLAGLNTPDRALARLLPTLRFDFQQESEALRDAPLRDHVRIREIDPAEVNARALAQFLSIPQERALELARTPHLFSD